MITIKELRDKLTELMDAGCDKKTPVYSVVSDRGVMRVKSIYFDGTLGFIIDAYPEEFSKK